MKNKTNKILAVALAVTLLALAAVAGTLAYLIDAENNTVTNIFTVGANVNISLIETDAVAGQRNIPYVVGGGATDKDPTIVVDKASETCYVFVEVVAEGSIAMAAPTEHATAHITYELDSNWTIVADAVGVNGGDVYAYTGTVDPNGTDDTELAILKGNQVYFENRSSVPEGTQSLSFTGYAIQDDTFQNAAAAWTALITQINQTQD